MPGSRRDVGSIALASKPGVLLDHTREARAEPCEGPKALEASEIYPHFVFLDTEKGEPRYVKPWRIPVIVTCWCGMVLVPAPKGREQTHRSDKMHFLTEPKRHTHNPRSIKGNLRATPTTQEA